MTTGIVYLLHFDAPIAPGRHTATHYLGYADALLPRVWAPMHGKGARFTQVAKERGIGFVVARTGQGGCWLDVLKFYLPLIEDDLRDAHAKFSPVDNL